MTTFTITSAVGKKIGLETEIPQHTVVSLPYYPIHLKEKIISKLIQKSKVVYLRCKKVHQYCKPYLKY